MTLVCVRGELNGFCINRADVCANGLFKFPVFSHLLSRSRACCLALKFHCRSDDFLFLFQCRIEKIDRYRLLEDMTCVLFS